MVPNEWVRKVHSAYLPRPERTHNKLRKNKSLRLGQLIQPVHECESRVRWLLGLVLAQEVR